jgi:two-component system response regulator FixJ
VAELAPFLGSLIYLVDPDEKHRQKMARLLRHLGYQTSVFGSAEEFLEALSEDSLNGCVISEMRLPGDDGLELLKRVKAQKADLPVIILTDDPDVSRAVKALRHKASDYMMKPVVDRELANRIRGVLIRALSGARSNNN